MILLIRNAAPYDFGGAERLPVFIAQGLNETGYSATVVSASQKLLNFAEQNSTPHIKGIWWPYQNWSGMRVLLFPIYIFWQIILTAWYVQLFFRTRPIAVHIQSKDDFIGGSLAAKLLGIRVIWSDYADLKHVWRNITVWYKNPVGKLVYLCAHIPTTITAVSRNDKAEIAAHLPGGSSITSKLNVVYVGVTDQAITPIDRPDNKLIFCAASRIVTDKGIGELLEAFSLLYKEVADVELWILGDGPDRKKFDNNQPGVTFFGHISNPLARIKTADVFILPTYHEGFSVALVEASMLGLAIIATRVGGNVEIINDGSTGLLVNARDPEDLLTAMQKLYQDATLRNNLGKAARRHYKENFEFSKMLSLKIKPLYE